MIITAQHTTGPSVLCTLVLSTLAENLDPLLYHFIHFIHAISFFACFVRMSIVSIVFRKINLVKGQKVSPWAILMQKYFEQKEIEIIQ